ncbi:MAG: hypothetical protein ACK47B_18380 [Armatimonadota bacterium]
MKRIIVMVTLAVATVGMAYWIEKSARPDTGRQGVQVQGESGHAH